MATAQQVRENLAKAAEAFNRRDPQALGACYAPDAVYSDPGHPEPVQGREAIVEEYAQFFKAFPDTTFEVLANVVEGDQMAVQWVMRGTHQDVLEGGPQPIPATGRPVEIRGLSLVQLDADGRFARDTGYFDMASLFQQLGLVPEPAT